MRPSRPRIRDLPYGMCCRSCVASVAPPTPIVPSVSSRMAASWVTASAPPTMRVLWLAVVRELETSIFGAAVQILPHSRRWSASDSSCAAEGQTFPSSRR
jgi:hypothetical protein